MAIAEVSICSFELLLSYFLNLALFDFHVFPTLKSNVIDHHFQSDDGVFHAIGQNLEVNDLTFTYK